MKIRFGHQTISIEERVIREYTDKKVFVQEMVKLHPFLSSKCAEEVFGRIYEAFTDRSEEVETGK